MLRSSVPEARQVVAWGASFVVTDKYSVSESEFARIAMFSRASALTRERIQDGKARWRG
jgi:hypothetical protein